MSTERFGLLGEHLGHSFSKIIQERLTGLPYELIEVPREGLDDFLREAPFSAVNVTIPYKQAVLPYLSSVSDEARKMGAVNVILNRGGRLEGHNTDYYGFISLARRSGIDFRGRKVLILGAGGGAKAVKAACEAMGASVVRNAVRSPKSAEDILLSAIPADNDFNIVVNATPVGMFPQVDGVPVSVDAFPCLEGALDIIYNPLRTNFILDAKAAGVPALGGLWMVVAQAVKAAELFHSCSYPESEIETIYSELLRSRRNIVLIGMPSSGKSTIGKMLARAEGLDFLDTDAMVEEKAGMKVREVFERFGEARFREMEREVVSEASARSGVVIATGGGVPLNPSNVRALSRGGIVVYLQTDPSRLQATSSRPLSTSREALEKMFEVRRPVYEAAADLTVDNNSSAASCLDRLRLALSLIS